MKNIISNFEKEVEKNGYVKIEGDYLECNIPISFIKNGIKEYLKKQCSLECNKLNNKVDNLKSDIQILEDFINKR